MKTLKDIQFLHGVRVLVRADFNVPIEKGIVRDDFRLRSALPTIQFLQSKKAKVILMSHIETEGVEKPTLEPVAAALKRLGIQATFIKKYPEARDIIEQGADGSVFLLENLRSYEGEKKNDPAFARELASLGDVYVNEAFSASHREHASIVGVPKLIPAYAGINFTEEIKHLSLAFKPSHPFLFILGGAKFETKIPLVSKFLDSADTIYIGGALANDMFKAKGYQTGTSVIAKNPLDLSALISNTKILIPTDVTTAEKKVKPADGLSPIEAALDIGPDSLAELKEKVAQAKFILWNGPLGVYEKGFTEMTDALAQAIADATSKGATSIIGGGDTLASIKSLGIEKQFSFVSTAGGAMLDFLAEGTLPGIEALEKSK